MFFQALLKNCLCKESVRNYSWEAKSLIKIFFSAFWYPTAGPYNALKFEACFCEARLLQDALAHAKSRVVITPEV